MMLKAVEELKNNMIEIENGMEQMSQDQKDFVKYFAIPVVFENIQNEIQYDKITFIVNGLKTIISDKITDDDLILSYYDILNKLRMIDIRILINLYKESKKMVRGYMVDRSDTTISEYDAVEIYIAKKLEGMYLVNIQKTINELQGISSKITPDRINISVLGTRLIEFFNICS